MARLSTAHLLLVSLCCLVVLAYGVPSSSAASCSQLPHPEACFSLYNSMGSLFAGDKAKLGFREFNIQGAMEHALRAHVVASAKDLSKLDRLTGAAWADCLELVSDTIDHLQRSMQSPSNDDSQTWLSAAAANQQTCLNGFSDLDVPIPSESELPIVSRNISALLSNSLAVNKAGTLSTKTNLVRKLLSLEKRSVFPEWVSVADRRLLQSSSITADLVVAQDGSGNYKTIGEAVAAASATKKNAGSVGKRFVIHVKAGVYNENVQISKSMTNLMIIGDGVDVTVVSGSKSVQDGATTFQTATFAISGNGFIARDMTFENTAGPQNHQAVAVRSGSDLSVFYRCSIKGYQDTLYVLSQRQFYRECDIYGTVDFIFGDAVAVFQNCNMYVRKPLSNQENTVTAQGRTDPNENTGISVHDCVVTAAPDLKPVQGSFRTYLGRPWQQYSRTVFMKTTLDSLIAPAGWLQWSGNFALSTLYYGEYSNTGPGSATSGRVSWPGYHIITSAAVAGQFTVGSFLSGNSWIPATGVPFVAGL